VIQLTYADDDTSALARLTRCIAKDAGCIIFKIPPFLIVEAEHLSVKTA
jgi:hypothetical protein